MTVVAEPFSISLSAAAKLVGCSERHLCRLAHAGELPGAYRLGCRWLVVRHRLLEGIEELAGFAPSPSAPRSSDADAAHASGLGDPPSAASAHAPTGGSSQETYSVAEAFEQLHEQLTARSDESPPSAPSARSMTSHAQPRASHPPTGVAALRPGRRDRKEEG